MNLVLSTGPCPVAVPNAATCTDITAVGLVCNLTQQCHATIPAGSKISQSPAAGEMVQPGTTVNLVLSTGPCPVAVPNAAYVYRHHGDRVGVQPDTAVPCDDPCWI